MRQVETRPLEQVVEQFVDLLRQLVREELEAQRGGAAPDDEFLTVTEAAGLVRRSVSTIAKWRRSGELRTYGDGRAVRVSRRELVELVQRGARVPAPRPERQRGEYEREAEEILARAGGETQ